MHLLVILILLLLLLELLEGKLVLCLLRGGLTSATTLPLNLRLDHLRRQVQRIRLSKLLFVQVLAILLLCLLRAVIVLALGGLGLNRRSPVLVALVYRL